jgi:hypothetical protein
MTLPAQDLRYNIATWAVPDPLLPCVSARLQSMLPSEAFDPHFQGQDLETTYFDTQGLELRKNRALHGRYITLRLRCYQGRRGESYAFSAKTEQEKFRAPLTPSQAHSLLAPGAAVAAILADILPPHLSARLLEISHDEPLVRSALVCCRRYAVEDDVDRYTLDVAVHTDTGKCLPFSVLEYKSTAGDPAAPVSLASLALRPLKLSKYLWATQP